MITFDKCKSFKGILTVPSDKSVTHRSLIMAAMADAVSVINNPLLSRDTQATMNALAQLGVSIVNEKTRLLVHSEGYLKFQEPSDIINCDNSGTTARLMTGLLAPAPFYSALTGDGSLRKRPMGRVTEPLKNLGASINGRQNGTLLPISILPSKMLTGEIESHKPSAQIKTAVILAGLQLSGQTTYIENIPTRDHTERMLPYFGADIKVADNKIIINGGKGLHGVNCFVPGDFSSAAFFIAAALIFENSEISIEACGLNPSRTGLLTALAQLGVTVDYEVVESNFEPYGTLSVKTQSVNGGTISGAITANLIDEIPVLALLGLFAEAPIEIRNAAELRVKESDRISALAENFKALGAVIEEFPDGLKIFPLKTDPKKCVLKSFDDHRICMINILLAKKFGINVMLDDVTPLDVSCPNFISDILDLEIK